MRWNDLPAQVLHVLEKLERAGYEAALVGGCVRDRLMGRAPGDYDITTSAAPEETQQVFADERVILTGLKHGTVTVLRDGMPMEITSFRQDGEYTDMRRPDSVRFTRSLREDVIRRDFTMNALAWEQDKGLIDHTGGAEDIRRGLIRAVGDPNRRFTEDALRILRAVRFSAQLGFAIEKETERALFALHGNIGRIAAERVRVELEKLLPGKDAPRVLSRYRDILRPRIWGGEGISDGQWEESVRLVEALQPFSEGKHLLLWAAWLRPLGAKGAAQALRALKAENAAVTGVQKRLEIAQGPMETMYQMRCLAGDHGTQAVRDAVLMRFAFAPEEREQALGLLDTIARESLPCTLAELAIDGKDLLAIGVRGKAIGDTLAELLDRVRANCLKNEKNALLETAKTCKK